MPTGLFPRAASLCTALLACACQSGSSREVVEPRYVAESGGAPEVERVTDLGPLSAVPAKGALPTAGSDGTFVVGEWILIEGEDFGKLPTVKIGNRPASSIARTRGGGIVAAIPNEVDGGGIEVEVSHPGGRSSTSMVLTRYLVAGGPDALHLVPVAGTGQLGAPLRVGYDALGAQAVSDVALSHDGRAAYAVDERGTVHVVSLVASGGPSKTSEEGALGASRLTTQPEVPVLVAWGGKTLKLFDTREATAISESKSITVSSPATAAALSPDGTKIAVLVDEGHAVQLYEVGSGERVAELELIAGEPAGLGRDLAFAPAGDALWVVSGNSAASLQLGERPAQVFELGLSPLQVRSQATVDAAQGPQALAVSRREAILAAAAVRSTKQRAAMVLSSLRRDTLAGTGQGAQLLRIDLEGKSEVLADKASLYGEVVLTHDQRFAFAIAEREGRFGITTASLEGHEPVFTELAPAQRSQAAGSLPHFPLAIAP